MHEIVGTASELLESYKSYNTEKKGPIDIATLLDENHHKVVKGKAQLWSMNEVCPAVALLDFEVIEDFSSELALQNLISVEIILRGNSEVQLGTNCRLNSGMPRIYLSSHGANSSKKRIHKAGEKYRTIGIWLSPRLFLETFGVNISSLSVDTQTVLTNPDSGIITLPVTATVIQIAHDIFNMPYQGMRAEQYLQAKFTELLCLIAELASCPDILITEDNALPKNKSETLIKLMCALEDSRFISLTLGEIACELGICKTTLSTVFKEGYGMKLSDYFLQRRMAMARNLLREGKLSTLQIALEVGYNNQSSFGRAYRQHYNRTPNEDRRLNRP